MRPGWKEAGMMKVDDLDGGGGRWLDFGCWKEVALTNC